MTTRNEMLRDALNDVVGKMTWRPDNTAVIHDAEAWRTLVGYIVMATNGDNDGQVPMGAEAEAHAPLDVERLARALEAAMSGQHVIPPALRSEFGLPPIWEPLAAAIAREYAKADR